MAAREHFRLETDLRFEPDNIAVEAILMVIEDAFGRGSARSVTDADGHTLAHLRCHADEVDARRVNWLHGQLALLAKYLLEPADVACSDDTGREQPYRLDPAAPARANDDAEAGTAEAETADANTAEG
jgi:hypothetical protein